MAVSPFSVDRLTLSPLLHRALLLVCLVMAVGCSIPSYVPRDGDGLASGAEAGTAERGAAPDGMAELAGADVGDVATAGYVSEGGKASEVGEATDPEPPGARCPAGSDGWDFDSSTEGFAFTWWDPAALEAQTTLIHDPNFGVLRATVGFDGVDQLVVLGAHFPDDQHLDLDGKIVTACVRLTSIIPASADAPGAAIFVRSKADLIDAHSRRVQLAVGTWIAVPFTANAPATVQTPPGTYDPTDIRTVALELTTGSTGTFGQITLELDAIWMR